jgi:hypothetical protein
MWIIDPKDKCIHKNKYDHIHTYMENMLVIVELLYGTWWEGRKGKENDGQQ